MRVNKQKAVRTVLVGYLLASTFILSSVAFANTESSTEVSTVPSTTQSKKATSSVGPEIPTIASSKEDVPEVTASKIEEPKRELTYEDHQLLEEAKADSAVPTVVFEEKQLDKEVHFHGTVSAGSEIQGNESSETALQSLILQRKDQNGEWKNHYIFSIDSEGIQLLNAPYSFVFNEMLENFGEYHYRLVADYVVKRLEDEHHQKGSLELGSVTVVEEVRESIPTVESYTSIPETGKSIETTESSAEEAKKSADSEEIVPKEDEKPLIGTPSETTEKPKTLINNQQIPEIQNNFMNAFQRGMGIMPLASATFKPVGSNYKPYFSGSHTQIESQPIAKARYTSKTKIELTLNFFWNYLSYGVNGTNLSLEDATVGIDTNIAARKYGLDFQFGESKWTTYGRTILGIVKQSDMVKQSGTDADGKLKKFENLRTVRVDVTSDNGYPTCNAWSDNVTTIVLSDIPVNTKKTFSYDLIYAWSANARIDYALPAPNFIDLSYVSTPTFKAIDEVTDKVVMQQGTFVGETTDDTTDGVLKATSNGVSLDLTVPKIEHSKDPNDKYYAKTIGGLTPGSEYRGRVELRNWLEDYYVQSGYGYFYTPNAVNKPTVHSKNQPTHYGDASLTMVGNYTVGTKPAHPTELEAQISTNNGATWTGLVPSSKKINTSSKSVSYTFSNLSANVNYLTRYRVKNKSDAWSPWAQNQSEVATNAVKLIISPPVVDKTATTTNQLVVRDGTYIGNITNKLTEANSGRLHYYNGLGGWQTVTTSLKHDQTLGGTYKGETITGLQPGTMHILQLQLMDTNGVLQRADSQAATLNTVTNPVIDTIHPSTSKYNASVTISGVYGIGPAGTTPAHPDKVKVQIKQDGAPNWTDVTSISTPSLDNQSIDESSTKGIFKINKLKASTKYHVRYQVENKGGWSEWSASEEFTTLGAPPALEIIDAPQLDFGLLEIKNYAQTANLSAASQKNHLIIDNTDTTKRWKLTASLEQLKRRDDPSIVMPWAILSMKINLQDSSDDGATWGNNSNGGTPRTVSFNSGDPAQDMWEMANSTDAQGLFRTEIDWNSVELRVPENQVGHYKGNLVWSLDDTL